MQRADIYLRIELTTGKHTIEETTGCAKIQEGPPYNELQGSLSINHYVLRECKLSINPTNWLTGSQLRQILLY